jgi:hypothetical protein
VNDLDLFTEALSLTDQAERAAFLDQACAGNPELRRRLEELLADDSRGASPLDRGVSTSWGHRDLRRTIMKQS